MAEAMVFLFETDGPDGAQDFGAKYMSLRKNNLQEMGKIY
jgi:hypothetical protein